MWPSLAVAGVLISLNIGVHPMQLVALVRNLLPAEVRYAVVTIGPFRQFSRVEVEIFRSASPIFLPQFHISITGSFLDSYKKNHWCFNISGFNNTS
jgi:hypothetical protein